MVKENPLTIPGGVFGAPTTTDPKVEQTTHEFQGAPGTVISVNGQFGVVTLVAADVGADVAGAAAAAQAASQPLNMNLTAIAALGTQAYGRGVLEMANAAAMRTYLGLGSAATHAAGDFDASGQAAAAYDAAVAYVVALTWVQTIQEGTGISVDATDPRNPIVSATGSGTGALTDGHIFVGDNSNMAADVPMSGDVTIDKTGFTTIKSSVNLQGTPTTTTRSQGDDSAAIATTEYVDIGLNATLTAAQLYLNAHGIFNNLGVPGYIIVADHTGIAAAVPMTGDVTIDDVGVTSVRASLALPGNPTTTTQAPGNNSTRIATTAYVDAAVTGMPVGSMVEYGGTGAPTGWLFCDGSAVSRATYAALFAVIGTTFGAGNGTTTFNLPDRRGKLALGASGTYPLGSTGGGVSTPVPHTLAAPTHTHTDGGTLYALSAANSSFIWDARYNVAAWTPDLRHTGGGEVGSTTSQTTGIQVIGTTGPPSATALTGGIPNLAGPIDPYLAVNVIIKV